MMKGQHGSGPAEEVLSENIYIDGSRDVSFGIFLGGAYIHTDHPSISNRLSKLIGIHSLVVGMKRTAVLKEEYTLPDVSQTVILTRMEGRTPMPPKEKLIDLARHNSSMVIFLSVSFMDELCKTLIEGGYSPDTPVAVVYKATWPEQKIVEGTLSDMPQKLKESKIDKTALTVVGGFLGNKYSLSKLYDKHFTTEYRKGVE